MLNTSEILSLAHNENLSEIIALCKQDIIESAAKESGGNSLLKRTKAAQKMLSKLSDPQIIRCGSSIQEINGAKYQTFTNGYYGFMLYEPLNGLQEAQGKGVDIYNLVAYLDNRKEVSVDISAVKAHLTEHKALTKGKKPAPICLYDIGNKRYNAQYIIDCYTILGGDITFYQDEDIPLSGAILESENGKALLMPFRK